MIYPYMQPYPPPQDYYQRRQPAPISQSVNDFKNIIIYGSLGIGTAAGLFLLGRQLVKKVQVKNTQSHSADEGNPATYAKQLNMAFMNDNYMGWGTNEELVFQTMRGIPTKAMYIKVQNAYYTMYRRSLNADLEDELSSSEYNEVIRILSLKPAK